MALKGGYKIIDFKNNMLSGESIVIPGIYEDIEENYDKVLIASGVGYDSAIYNDEIIAVDVDESNWIIKFHNGDFIITITDDDEVTIAEKTPTFVDAPASASADGVAGQIAIADGFLYVCVDEDTWQRVAIATWS